MGNGARIESILKHDRLIVVLGIVGVSALAWAYLLYLSQGTSGMAMEQAMPQMQGWEAFDVTATFTMWVVMMVAMMLPSTTPAVLLFTRIEREKKQSRSHAAVLFVSGYLAVWAGFSVGATLAQWGLHTAVALSPTMAITSPVVGGAVLVVAGLFQWTPLKHACLTHCRSPQGFFMTEWREGAPGALFMGLKHGSYCVGCCWLLMGLIFVAGMMNLAWVAIIAAFVLAEKVAPARPWISRVAGMLLAGWGFWMMAEGLFR